jgi:hypothetical protein
LLRSNENISAELLSARLEANPAARRIAQDELYQFVKATIRSLVKQEYSLFHTIPSLKQFCRVDVGLIKSGDGTMNYFVNEIERGINVSLWSGYDGPERLGKVVEPFAEVLHSWITEEKVLINDFAQGM